MAIDPLSTVVATNKNIQITIDIHVRCGHRIRKCRRQNDGSAWRKATVPIITEDQHTTLQADDQILINIIIQVHEQGGMTSLQPKTQLV